MTPVVELSAITRRFGALTAVDALSVSVDKGGVLALLGPSGCGKSTTLRMIAGLEDIDAGTISLAGEVVSRPGMLVPPERRRVGYVFQSFALFPHLSVEDNVAFGARDRSRLDELLALVRLADRRSARIHTLSGGEQQRVALIRALAAEPRVVLLDEPFANLDASLRRHLRDEIATTLRAREATAIVVTHDASEAFTLADHVAVMAAGKLLQHGTPEDVYARPVSLEVAQRTGETVELRGRLVSSGVATTCLGEVALARPTEQQALTIIARPEQLAIDPRGQPARVVRRVFEGGSTLLELRAVVDDTRLALRAIGIVRAEVGETVPVRITEPVVAY